MRAIINFPISGLAVRNIISNAAWIVLATSGKLYEFLRRLNQPQNFIDEGEEFR